MLWCWSWLNQKTQKVFTSHDAVACDELTNSIDTCPHLEHQPTRKQKYNAFLPLLQQFRTFEHLKDGHTAHDFSKMQGTLTVAHLEIHNTHTLYCHSPNVLNQMTTPLWHANNTVTHQVFLTRCWHVDEMHIIITHSTFLPSCWHIYEMHTLKSLIMHHNQVLIHLWSTLIFSISHFTFLTRCWHIYEQHTLLSFTTHT